MPLLHRRAGRLIGNGETANGSLSIMTRRLEDGDGKRQSGIGPGAGLFIESCRLRRIEGKDATRHLMHCVYCYASETNTLQTCARLDRRPAITCRPDTPLPDHMQVDLTTDVPGRQLRRPHYMLIMRHAKEDRVSRYRRTDRLAASHLPNLAAA